MNNKKKKTTNKGTKQTNETSVSDLGQLGKVCCTTWASNLTVRALSISYQSDHAAIHLHHVYVRVRSCVRACVYTYV